MQPPDTKRMHVARVCRLEPRFLKGLARLRTRNDVLLEDLLPNRRRKQFLKLLDASGLSVMTLGDQDFICAPKKQLGRELFLRRIEQASLQAAGRRLLVELVGQ